MATLQNVPPPRSVNGPHAELLQALIIALMVGLDGGGVGAWGEAGNGSMGWRSRFILARSAVFQGGFCMFWVESYPAPCILEQ